MSKAIALIKNISFDPSVNFPIKLTDKIIIHDFYNGLFPYKKEIHTWVKDDDKHWNSYPYVLEIKGDFKGDKLNLLFQDLKWLIGLIRLFKYNRVSLAHVLFFNSACIISNDNHYGLFADSKDQLTQKDVENFAKNISLLKVAKNIKRLSTSIYFWNASSCSETYENALIQLFIALESLLTTDNTEVTYKLAHRFSWLYTNDHVKRLEVLKKIKKGYKDRSYVVHGRKFVNIDDLKLVKEIHSMTREIILKIFETKNLFNNFTGQEETLNIFLDSLVLGNENL